MDDQLPEIPKRKRGRPPGSKNRARHIAEGPREKAEGQKPYDDYAHADPMAMAARLYSEVDWQLSAIRNQRAKYTEKATGRFDKNVAQGEQVDFGAVDDLSKVAGTLEKAMKAHERALVLAEKLAKLKTPAQVLQAAIDRIKGQDLPTLRNIIKELKKYMAAIAPVSQSNALAAGSASAADFINELED